MSSGGNGRQEINSEINILDDLIERNKDVQAAEQRLLDMELDEALLALNALNWNPEDFSFVAGYLTARPIPRNASYVELIGTASHAMEDCKFLILKKQQALPALVVLCAVSRLAAAVADGVDLRNHFLHMPRYYTSFADITSIHDNADNEKVRFADPSAYPSKSPPPSVSVSDPPHPWTIWRASHFDLPSPSPSPADVE